MSSAICCFYATLRGLTGVEKYGIMEGWLGAGSTSLPLYRIRLGNRSL